jgi:hypothetical protein
MKRYGWVVSILLAAGVCAPLSLSIAAALPQANAAAGVGQDARAEFKQAAIKFMQSAQAYLAVTTLQWQNFMMVPRAGAVTEISAKNADYKAKVASEFDALMAMPGASEAVSPRLKDYFAEWGAVFDAMRPTEADGSRGFSARTNSEMRRMDAMASRIKMDL